jgi:hypothetical protein
VSDHRLRALERRYHETLTASDLAAWLQARVRAGELRRVRLVLGRRLGSAAAALALGEEEPPDSGPPVLVFKDWLRSMRMDMTREMATRVLLACARHVRPHVVPRHAELAEACLVAAEEWLACPCEQHATSAAEAADLFALELERPFPFSAACRACLAACSLAGGGELQADDPAYLVRDSINTLIEAGVRRSETYAGLQAAIREALIPWVLGLTS